MQSLYGLYVLVDRYATAIEKLNLNGDEREEYSTVLLRLQNQVETGEPSDRIVNECLDWLSRFTSRVTPALEGNAA
jgi:hypothetical protein